MKKQILLFTCLTGLSFAQAQNVTIPDTKFKNAIIAQGVDTNNDSIIQVSEALATKKLIVYSKSIDDLTGIEAFTNLTFLSCDTNNLTALDVSANLKLDTLICVKNKLTTLDVSMLTNLKKFNCALNKFTTFDISANTNLEWFDVGGTAITSLNLGSSTKLNYIDIVACSSLPSVDLSGLPNLETLLAAQTTKLSFLDVSLNTKLQTLLLISFLPKSPTTICVNPTQKAKQPTGWQKSAGDVYTTTGCKVGIDELEIKTDKKLLHIYNLLGEEVKANEVGKGIFIYQYNDGSIEKKAVF